MNLHLYAGPSQGVEHLHIKGWHGAVVEHLHIILFFGGLVLIGVFHCFWVYMLGFKNRACVKEMTNMRRLYIKGWQWHSAVVVHLSRHFLKLLHLFAVFLSLQIAKEVQL